MEAAESTEASEGSTIVLSENASGETRAELKVLMARQMRWRSPFREAPTSLEERPFRGEAPKGGAPPKGGEVILERGVLGGRGRGPGRGGGRRTWRMQLSVLPYSRRWASSATTAVVAACTSGCRSSVAAAASGDKKGGAAGSSAHSWSGPTPRPGGR